MAKKNISQRQIEAIRMLRAEGHSLVDIRRRTLLGTSTIHKYTRDVRFEPKPHKARMRHRHML